MTETELSRLYWVKRKEPSKCHRKRSVSVSGFCVRSMK